MKFMVISDIHGSVYYLTKALKVFEKEKADVLVILGDYLNHAPRNDLPQEYGPMKVVSLLNSMKDKILAIKGNCDSEVDQELLKFPLLSQAMIVSGEHKIFLTHGHIYNENNLPPMGVGDVLMHGHFHIPWLFTKDNVLIVSPGSISIPRGGSKPSYLTIVDGIIEIKELDSQRVINDEIGRGV